MLLTAFVVAVIVSRNEKVVFVEAKNSVLYLGTYGADGASGATGYLITLRGNSP
jgi:hypothetical protein